MKLRSYRYWFSVIAIVALSTMILNTAQPTRAALLFDTSNLVITMPDLNKLWMDSNQWCSPNSAGPDGVHVRFRVTNPTADTYTDVTMTVFEILDAPDLIIDDPVRFIGTLTPGAYKDVFVFVDYHILRTYLPCASARPPITYNWPFEVQLESPGNITSRKTLNFEAAGMISALAGGKFISYTIGAMSGDIFSVWITYEFGNNPTNSRILMEPAGNWDFADQAYRLVGTQVTASNVTGIPVGATNQIYFYPTDSANGNTVTVRYDFQQLSITSTNLKPWSVNLSGSDYKYASTVYGSIPLLFTTAVEVNKSASLLVDFDGNGLPSAGDTLRYTVTVVNNGNVPTISTHFVDPVSDPNLTLVAGSVTTTQGSVTLGNTSGDTSVDVLIGSLAVGATITIRFDVQINTGLPPNVLQVANQGAVVSSGLDEPSNDPATTTDDDITITSLVKPSIILDKRLVSVDTDPYYPNYATFAIDIKNTGTIPIDVLPLVDDYDPMYLEYYSATPAPSSVDSVNGTLTWNDLTLSLGNLAPGQTFTVEVKFLVIADIVSTVNVASTDGVPDGEGGTVAVADIGGSTVPAITDSVSISNIPTLSLLEYFTIDLEAEGVLLAWQTVTGATAQGFYILRATRPDVYLAQVIGTAQPDPTSLYTFVDDSFLYGRTYWYWLSISEAAELDNIQGPLSITTPYSINVSFIALPLTAIGF